MLPGRELVASLWRACPPGTWWILPATAIALATQPEAARADALTDALDRADMLALHGRVPAAVALYDSIEAAARQRGDAGAERQALLRRGVALTQIGQTGPAERDLRRALELATAAHDSSIICSATGWLGTATMFQGRFAEAVTLYRRAIQLAPAMRDTVVEGWAHTGLGFCMIQGGDLPSARQHYTRALELFRADGFVTGELNALVGLGIVELQLGEFDAASQRYREIIERSRATGELLTEAQAWNNLGAIEFQRGDPALAVEYYQRAVDIHRRRGELREIVTSQHNVAVALMQLGRLDEAAALLDSARVVCERNGFLEARARVLHQLGHARLLQGRPAVAVDCARRSLEGSAGLSVELRARALGDLARALAALGRRDEAYAVLAAQAPVLRPGLGVRDRVDLDVLRADLLLALGRPREALALARDADREAARGGLDARRLHPLALAARCETALGEPERARATLREAAAVWERQRTVPRDPEWRAERGAHGREIFADLAILELERDRGTADERARAAFDLVQPFKARVLYERLSGVASASAPALAPPRVTLAAVQSEILRPGELLLDAFLGPVDGVLFAVTRDRIRAVRISGTERLEARIRDLRDLLGAPATSAEADTLIATASRAIRDSLLRGVEDLVGGSRRIVFAADGALNLLPIGALGHGDVALVPSVALLGALRAHTPEAPGARPSVVVAGGAGQEGLGGAAWEVARLVHRYQGVVPARRRDGSPRSLDGQIIHVAGHAEVDDQRPWRSGFTLGAGRDGAPVRLTAAEIAARRLPAQLAVLAGCTSAGGRVLSGEGVQGLTAAFMGAGVPTVVASLWPVDDAATARLVEQFYSELARGRPAGEALRSAQRAVQKTGRSHPFYWAGFILVGDPEITVTLRRRVPWGEALAVLLAAMAGLVLVGAGRRRRRRLPGMFA